MKFPSRTTALFAVALTATTGWVIAAIAGLHPDGAILGFSGTMWAVWATTDRRNRGD